MLWVFRSQLAALFLPLGGEYLSRLVLFDKTLDPHERRLVFSYYEAVVKRHVFARGAQSKVFLSKNPPFTMRLDSLRTTFPDARLVCLLRDPLESVPSMVSYIAAVWAFFASPRVAYPNADGLFDFCIQHYSYPLVCFRDKSDSKHDIPPSGSGRFCGGPAGTQVAFVYYEALRLRLVAVVVALLQDLGYTRAMSSEFLRAEESLSSRYRSSHGHSPELCCQRSPTEMREIFKTIYDTFDFDGFTPVLK
jgi:hypothetical protein